jgi:hypothetical protein
VAKSETGKTLRERASALAFPLLLFAASRFFHFVFALAGPVFGPPIGSDGALSRAFQDSHPVWARLAHGEIAHYARVARGGYLALADVPYFPLLPLLGKATGALFGSVEVGLLVISLVLCALAFVGLYRLCEELVDAETARWGVGLLAAFPLSYHLSDGSALSALLAFSAWGVLFASRGRRLGSAIVLSLGVLAHPACGFAAVALAWPPQTALRQAAGGWSRLLALLPAAVLLGWLGLLGSKVHATAAGMWAAFVPTASKPLSDDWWVMMVGFGILLGAGALLLARTRALRVLAIVGVAQLASALGPGAPPAAYAMAACWPAFVAGGDLLARHKVLRGPAVTMLAVHQGLLLYCFTHYLRLA